MKQLMARWMVLLSIYLRVEGLSLVIHLPVFWGFGVGGINQEVSFLSSFLGKQEEKDFLLCSHLFAGLEFRPTEHLIIGLGYRWLSVAEMKKFFLPESYISESCHSVIIYRSLFRGAYTPFPKSLLYVYMKNDFVLDSKTYIS